jgi:hypothetical protein
VNVILVPALLLLIGLAVYKKVVEPRRAAGGQGSGAKVDKKAGKKVGKKVGKGAVTNAVAKADTRADKKAVKARAASGSGRMGSVL